jgi:16S rRNA (uracil1498-N3)-methyltransferase
VAISAMKQSHSAYLPELKLLNFEEALRNSEELSIGKYIGYCGEADKQPIRSCIVPSVFLIGPEGDFSEHEYTLAATNGFLGIEMGKSILRTETAAVAAISALRLK